MIDSLARMTDPRPQPRPIEWPGTPAKVVPLHSGQRLAHVFTAMLDEVDYPMLVVAADMTLIYANKSGRFQLDDAVPFEVHQGALRCTAAQDALAAAVTAACQRELRAMVHLRGAGDVQLAVAVVPMNTGCDPAMALLMLPKQRLCEALSVQAFARIKSFTATETRVLEALCAGRSARTIASLHGVALSTLRTQIGSMRAKAGARDIRELVQQVAVLPPLLSVLRR